MKRWMFALVVALSACSHAPPPASPVALGASVHANGVVEPVGEERLIIPQLTGRVEQVLVDEGDLVEAGQLLAELENAEQRAIVAAAEADVRRMEAELARLQNGARVEEIRAARAASDEAAALAQQAKNELERRQHMAEKKLVSQELLEDARTRAATAFAASERLNAQRDLLLAGARMEDIAAAQAALAMAQAQAQRAAAELEKTRIRAPIAGVVLKRVLNGGETVTALSPEPLVAIGDLSGLRVRAEINELDLSRVAVGATVLVRSDAFPRQEFSGHVARVARRMGVRAIISDDPSLRRDAKTLEVMIDLDHGAPLPIGLRVDVQISAEVVGPPGLEPGTKGL